MKRYIQLLIVLLFAMPVSSQGLRSSLSIPNPDTRLKTEGIGYDKTKGGKRAKRSQDNRKEDYVLYRNIVRKYSWLVGQGDPISKEVANHLPFYFRLSMKNDLGHWQHIEAMHGDTLTNRHNISPYFINKDYDSGVVNSEWFANINNSVQWFLTSDLSGNNVVEERAYNKDGDMIYGFIIIQNDSTHVTGSYNDSWGRPADFNEREENVYGSVVYITYDRNGCDSIVDYLDGKGYRKLNSNGVDQDRCVYDDKLRPILRTSQNCIGDRMIDNWGNCGNVYEYAEDGMSYTITRVDQDLNPIRMPDKRASFDQTFIRCKVILDEWGREKEKIILSENGENDETLSHIHHIIYEYDKDGIVISTSYFDINNNPIIDYCYE